MYSVIIQNKESLELFSSYRSLFADAVQKGQVGFCTWNQNGKNIDECLPDIRELTDDKKEWRAIIICSDFTFLDYQRNGVQNPFDFFSNAPEDDLSESGNSLIRLTHMLGGVPPIEREFKDLIIHEPYKEPRLVYEPIENKEREIAYRELKGKYEFDGVYPSTVVLISPRLPWKGDNEISANWKSHVESSSSEFWKRNRYPSICRFLTFDFVKQGPVRKEADLFRFWITVMTLATNQIDPSSLQAYRLYNANVEIDSSEMEESFQVAVNRISSARAVIRNELRREMRGFSNADNKLPDYKVKIPVMIDVPQSNRRIIKYNIFPVICKNPATDIANWDTEKKHAEEMLLKSIRIADRALDQTASRMKESYIFDESEVIRLDKYQKEDMELETDLLYKDIIDVQGKLPSSSITTSEEKEQKATAVRNHLKGRTTIRPVIYTFIMGTVLFIAAEIPAVLQHFIGESISWPLVGLEVLTFIAVMLACGIVTLFGQKKHLDLMVREFNKEIQGAFNALQSNASEYTKYLSAIASHSRGRSYIDIAEKKNLLAVSARNMRYKHLSAIDMFLSKLKTWGDAFHLDVDYEKPAINDEIVVDVMTPPVDNLLYSLEAGKSYDIEVNKSGMMIQTPFSFINKLNLVREELYDDDIL